MMPSPVRLVALCLGLAGAAGSVAGMRAAAKPDAANRAMILGVPSLVLIAAGLL